MKIVVLGSGLVGRHIAGDLSGDRDKKVKIVDINEDSLDRVKEQYGNKIETIKKDLRIRKNLFSVLKDCDIAVNAVPGSMGFAVLKGIIENGTDVVDIAFYGEDPFELDELARKNSVTSIVDMGIAPGISNLLVGYLDSETEKLYDVNIYVGGLPKVRKLPFEYKAVFSPSDVIEEYTRPARVVENGKIVVKKPLTEPEFLEFKDIGTLEAFNSDGLRTLIRTVKAVNMKEKTLRYPGHREKMKLFSESGFFDKEKFNIGGGYISPLEITSRLLYRHWHFSDEDRDFTVMRIVITGSKKSEMIRYTFDLYDEFDEERHVHSMARTTGYTAAMGTRLIADKKFSHKGVFPPEMVGRLPEIKDFVMSGLAKRDIHFSEKYEDI